MIYLYTYTIFNIILIILLAVVHDLIIVKQKKDNDFMFQILLFAPLLIFSESRFFKGILSLFVFFIIAPIIIIKNINNMIIENRNKFSKKYSEYFYFKIPLKNKTIKRLGIFLKQNNINYKKKYLNNISSYALKTIHDMILKLPNSERINITKEYKDVFLDEFSKKLEVDKYISNHIFFLIKEELTEWILQNRSLDGIDNIYVFDEDIVIVNKHFNSQEKYERKTVVFNKKENLIEETHF